MMWETIDRLKSNDLSRRADELRQCLEGFADQDLVLFQKESVMTFLNLFSPSIYHLYCIAFEGETNGSGLTDFCSNLMLSGRSLVDAVLLNPDNFADVSNAVPFNDDSGLSMISIASRILDRRYNEDVAEEMLRLGGVDSLDGIWEKLESQVGSLNFEPNWQLAKSDLPRLYAKTRR